MLINNEWKIPVFQPVFLSSLWIYPRSVEVGRHFASVSIWDRLKLEMCLLNASRQ